MSAPRLSSDVVTTAAVVGAMFVALQLVILAVKRWWRRRSLATRFARAAVGEARAATLLARAGYDVLAAQVPGDYPVGVDGEVVMVSLRADYLVVRAGARYVVEVKTGAHAPRIDSRATRRQLLEYRVAFDVDGVLLVDAERETIHEITFPSAAFADRTGDRSGRGAWGWLALGAVLVVLAVLAAQSS